MSEELKWETVTETEPKVGDYCCTAYNQYGEVVLDNLGCRCIVRDDPRGYSYSYFLGGDKFLRIPRPGEDRNTIIDKAKTIMETYKKDFDYLKDR